MNRELQRPESIAAIERMRARQMYYDRDGIPIDEDAWSRLRANYAYKRVARTTITDAADPTKTYDVSTVWLGLDHAFGMGPPLIFETMVFGEGSSDLECERYSTEKQAREGHIAMVTVVCSGLTDPVVMDVDESGGEGRDAQT